MSELHTPGYWETSVLSTTAASGEIVHEWEICGPGGGDAIAAVVSGPQAEANARLLASAPKMLEALRRLTHPMAIDEDVDFALKAIAEATGQDIDENNRPPSLED